jgi:hypothetical protein
MCDEVADLGDGNGSAVSLVSDPPSTCSSPPSSLFSEDDKPRKSTHKNRRPFREILLDSSNDDVQLLPGLATPEAIRQQLSVSTPGTVSSTFLLPAIHNLKNNLQETHQSLYLMQEENKSLSAECYKLEKQCRELEQAMEYQTAVAKDKEQQWLDAVALLETENDALGNERLSLQEKLSGLLHIQDKMAAVVKEKEMIQRKMETMISESNSSPGSLADLQVENGQLRNQLENTMHRAEAVESERFELMENVKKLEADIQQMHKDRREQESRFQAIQEERESLRLSLQNVQSTVIESNEAALKISSLRMEIQSLRDQLLQSLQENNTLRSERNVLQQKVLENRKSRSDGGTQTHQDVINRAVQTLDDVSVPALILPTSSLVSASGQMSERLGRIRDAAERAAVVQDYRRELSRLKMEHDAYVRKLNLEHDAALRQVIQEAKSEVSTTTKKFKELLTNEYESKLEAFETRHQAELEGLKEDCERTVAVSDEAVQAAVVEIESLADELESERLKSRQLQEALGDYKRQLNEWGVKRLSSEDLSCLREDWQKETTVLLEHIRTACETIFDDQVAGRMGSYIVSGNKTVPPPPAAKPALSFLRSLSVNESASGWSPRSVLCESAIQNENAAIGDQNVFRRVVSLTTDDLMGKYGLYNKASSDLFSSAELEQTLAETEAIVTNLMKTN